MKNTTAPRCGTVISAIVRRWLRYGRRPAEGVPELEAIDENAFERRQRLATLVDLSEPRPVPRTVDVLDLRIVDEVCVLGPDEEL